MDGYFFEGLGDLGRGAAHGGSRGRGNVPRGTHGSFRAGHASRAYGFHPSVRSGAFGRSWFGWRPGRAFGGYGSRANWARHQAWLARIATYGTNGAAQGAVAGAAQADGGPGGGSSGGGSGSGGDTGSQGGGQDMSAMIQQIMQEIEKLKAEVEGGSAQGTQGATATDPAAAQTSQSGYGHEGHPGMMNHHEGRGWRGEQWRAHEWRAPNWRGRSEWPALPAGYDANEWYWDAGLRQWRRRPPF